MNDGTVDSNVATVSITVSAVNDAPVAVADSYSVLKNGTLNVAAAGVLINDIDVDSPANTLTAIKDTDPTHGTLALNSDGSFTYTPTVGWSGNDSFSYHANDGTADSNIVTVSISVNDINEVPTDIGLSNNSVAENQPIATVVGTLSTVDPDTGDTFSYSLVSGIGDTDNGSFTISGASLRTSDVFDFETKSIYAIRVRSTDQGGLYIEKEFIITVSNVNEAPVITEGASTAFTMSEDGVRSCSDLTLHATDVDGDMLTWSISSAASHGIATASGTGTFKVIGYTPDSNYNGSDSFVVQVSDGNGGTDTITVSIGVSAVNDAPVAADQSVTTAEDTAKAITLVATDVEGDTLTWAVGTPAHGTLTGTAPDVTYTPAANYNGSDSFTFTVNDGTVDSNVATVSLTVSAVNDAPVAADAVGHHR